MFARNVALRLRPNCLNEFRRIIDAHIIPLLREQPGFKDLITFDLAGGSGADITAISLWDTRTDAEAYSTKVYPEAMRSLQPLLEGIPHVRLADIGSSTLHKIADIVAA